MTTQKVNSASTVAENLNLSEALQKEQAYICAKIKEFAVFKSDLIRHLETGAAFENLTLLSDVLAETENSGDEFYTHLLSIYGVIVEKEVSD